MRRTIVAVLMVGVVGCGGDDGGNKAVTRTVQITATDYKFADLPTDLVAGDRVAITLVNRGPNPHNLEVTSSNGSRLGRIEAIAAGQTAQVVVAFDTAGHYRFTCDFADHLIRGMRSMVTVGNAAT